MSNMFPIYNISDIICYRIFWGGYLILYAFYRKVFNVVLNDVINVCKKVCDSVIIQMFKLFLLLAYRCLVLGTEKNGLPIGTSPSCFLLSDLDRKDKRSSVFSWNNPLYWVFSSGKTYFCEKIFKIWMIKDDPSLSYLKCLVMCSQPSSVLWLPFCGYTNQLYQMYSIITIKIGKRE